MKRTLSERPLHSIPTSLPLAAQKVSRDTPHRLLQNRSCHHHTRWMSTFPSDRAGWQVGLCVHVLFCCVKEEKWTSAMGNKEVRGVRGDLQSEVQHSWANLILVWVIKPLRSVALSIYSYLTSHERNRIAALRANVCIVSRYLTDCQTWQCIHEHKSRGKGVKQTNDAIYQSSLLRLPP